MLACANGWTTSRYKPCRIKWCCCCEAGWARALTKHPVRRAWASMPYGLAQ
jgi:hypothetical protein